MKKLTFHQNRPSRILVFEPEPKVSIELIELLEPESFKISCSTSLKTTFRAIKETSSEIILIDIYYWNQFGARLFFDLKTRHPEIHCLIMAEFHQIDAAMEAVLEGADDFLRKPILKWDLLITLNQCLKRAPFEPLNPSLELHAS